MAGKCRRCLQFVSEANPIEGGPKPSQTQQIKVAAFCGQVYPCQCSPLETINRETCIYVLQYYCYSIVNNQQPYAIQIQPKLENRHLSGVKQGKITSYFSKDTLIVTLPLLTDVLERQNRFYWWKGIRKYNWIFCMKILQNNKDN